MYIKLEDTVAVVQKEICGRRAKYESVVKTEEHGLTMVEGSKTSITYFCQLIVSPQEVVRIFVDYDYVFYRVYEEDASDVMREDLGQKFGRESFYSVDI